MQIEKLIMNNQNDTENLISKILKENCDTQILVAKELIEKAKESIKYIKDANGYLRVATCNSYNYLNAGISQLVIINKKGCKNY